MAAEGLPQTRPATAPAATQPAKKLAIPLIYANKQGKPFPEVPPEEVADIRRAGEMTPPGEGHLVHPGSQRQMVSRRRITVRPRRSTAAFAASTR